MNITLTQNWRFFQLQAWWKKNWRSQKLIAAFNGKSPDFQPPIEKAIPIRTRKYGLLVGILHPGKMRNFRCGLVAEVQLSGPKRLLTDIV